MRPWPRRQNAPFPFREGGACGNILAQALFDRLWFQLIGIGGESSGASPSPYPIVSGGGVIFSPPLVFPLTEFLQLGLTIIFPPPDAVPQQFGTGHIFGLCLNIEEFDDRVTFGVQPSIIQ